MSAGRPPNAACSNKRPAVNRLTSGAGPVTRTLAVAKLAALLAFTAHTVTVAGEGTTAGAV